MINVNTPKNIETKITSGTMGGGAPVRYLFRDNFESGDLSAWSESQTDAGSLAVTAGAAMHGARGMAALINDANDIYVKDLTPNDETRYRVRFWFDPNSITMADNDEINLMQTWNNSYATVAFRLYFKKVGANYTFSARDPADGAWNRIMAFYPITDAPHYIELDWQAASAAGANNGHLSMWFDGVLQETLANIDNDTERIGVVLFGPTEIDAGTSGTLYIDDFWSNNTGDVIGTRVF
jgi:hypothetical protein